MEGYIRNISSCNIFSYGTNYRYIDALSKSEDIKTIILGIVTDIIILCHIFCLCLCKSRKIGINGNEASCKSCSKPIDSTLCASLDRSKLLPESCFLGFSNRWKYAPDISLEKGSIHISKTVFLNEFKLICSLVSHPKASFNPYTCL